MKKFISKYIPKNSLILELLTQYEIFQTNCPYENAKAKAQRFLESKKQEL